MWTHAVARKLAVGVAAVAVLGWLFWQTVQSTLAEPYRIDAALAQEWRLVLRGPMQPGAGLLVLQPNDQLRAELFQQIFSRTMESMTSPAEAAMPIVLHDEYRGSLGGALSPADVLAAAEAEGLDRVRPVPRCVGVLREAAPGRTRQLYYALFDAPEVDRFRETLARRHAAAGGETPFVPGRLALAVPVAASDGDFAGWWPLEVRADTECLAPLTVR